MVGSVGGMFAAKAVGYTLQWTRSYTPVFAIAGSVYLLAFILLQTLVPKIQTVPIAARAQL
jgi:ACS family hexuronate transporter-like MFS transporter